MSSRVLRGAVGKGVQVHAQARRRWDGENKYLQGPERGGGHGHVVTCPGLQRAVACESMPAEPRGVSGSVGADTCRGQSDIGYVRVGVVIDERLSGNMRM